MKSHDQEHRPLAEELEWRESEAQEVQRESTSRRSPAHAVRVSTLVLIAVAGSYVLLGCGQHHEEPLSQSTSDNTSMTVAQPASAGLPPAPVVTSIGGEDGTTETQVATSADAVPPEVEASAKDSLVTRGTVVEVTAQGSGDVVAVSLKDDLGTEQAMTYDSTAGVWRGYYRVPLKARSERVALSVTAKNATGKWRRVWLFLDVAHEAGREPVANPEQ